MFKNISSGKCSSHFIILRLVSWLGWARNYFNNVVVFAVNLFHLSSPSTILTYVSFHLQFEANWGTFHGPWWILIEEYLSICLFSWLSIYLSVCLSFCPKIRRNFQNQLWKSFTSSSALLYCLCSSQSLNWNRKNMLAGGQTSQQVNIVDWITIIDRVYRFCLGHTVLGGNQANMLTAGRSLQHVNNLYNKILSAQSLSIFSVDIIPQ